MAVIGAEQVDAAKRDGGVLRVARGDLVTRWPATRAEIGVRSTGGGGPAEAGTPTGGSAEHVGQHGCGQGPPRSPRARTVQPPGCIGAGAPPAGADAHDRPHRTPPR